ncbi:MAG: DoxX family protein [Acidobacteria bacterium]|nr:DoxX family protein [Acidobacteriota bacterium]
MDKKVWTGRALSGLAALFLAFDGVIKLLAIEPVLASFAQLGYPVSLAVPIGTLELLCLSVHLFPRTAVFGAVLLTGYLGGGIASHVRLQDPLFTHSLFPVYIGALLWGGLYLRDTRLRAFRPW